MGVMYLSRAITSQTYLSSYSGRYREKEGTDVDIEEEEGRKLCAPGSIFMISFILIL